jgi:glycosyltransferase involved in cell wall biosynthesis
MKILIINHYIGSSHYGMDYRQYYLAREWVKMGHEVSMLGADFSHLRIHQPEVSKDLDTEIIEGIRYFWIKTPHYKSSGFGRMMNILAFVFKALFYHQRIARKLSPDVVLVASTYVLDIYPAYRIAKQTGAKLVYELHDLWPLSPMIIGGYSKRHPFITMVQRAENFACRHCDYFVSLLGNAKEYLVAHGLKPERFIYIPNGYSEDDRNDEITAIPSEHKKVLEDLRSHKKMIIGYAGGHAPSNALTSLIKAARMVPAEMELAFVMVGNGSEKSKLIKLAENQDHIYFLPPVSKAAIPDFLSHCDILYAGGISSTLHTYGTSFNKVTDYMLSGKPILFAVDDPNSLVEQVGCGVQVPAEKPELIAAALISLAGQDSPARTAMGIKGKEYAESELGYSSIAQKILDSIGVN